MPSARARAPRATPAATCSSPSAASTGRRLLASSQSLSLFAERRIIEVRMPTPRPGKDGGAVLAKLASDPAPDTLLLVVTGRPERDTWSAAWFKAFEKQRRRRAGLAGRDRAPAAVDRRARRAARPDDRSGWRAAARRTRRGQSAGGAPGNREAGVAACRRRRRCRWTSRRRSRTARATTCSSSARQRSTAMQRARLRILDGLRAEGAEPPLVLWALCRELRALADGAAQSRRAARLWTPGRTPSRELLRARGRADAGQSLAPLFAARAR